MSNDNNNHPQQPRGENPNHPVAQLTKLIGFDASKPQRLSQEFFDEVVKEVNEGRVKQAKDRAKDLLTKAIALQDDKTKRDREYASASKKFDKELGKVVGQIRAMLDGTTYKDPDAPKGDEAE